VRVNEPCAAGLEIHVGVAYVGFALAEGLDLSAVKDEAGLMPFKNMVVIGGGAILSDDLLARFGGLLSFFCRYSHNAPS
jgi:hypothetical protein